VDPFHATKRDAFERDIAALMAAIPTHSDLNLTLETMRIVATVGDAYTQAVPPASTPLRLFPLRVQWLTDGYYVTGAAADLVIDLRFNGGGDSGLARPLLKALAARPALAQEGHLYVLVGPDTYSSAVLTVVRLDLETGARFVGEPPASIPDHYGQVRSFYLPGSRIRVDYATKHFPMTDYAGGERFSFGQWLGVLGYTSDIVPFDGEAEAFVPELIVSPTIEDYLAGRDPVLDAALAD
jgi:hypothetical protein